MQNNCLEYRKSGLLNFYQGIQQFSKSISYWRKINKLLGNLDVILWFLFLTEIPALKKKKSKRIKMQL